MHDCRRLKIVSAFSSFSTTISEATFRIIYWTVFAKKKKKTFLNQVARFEQLHLFRERTPVTINYTPSPVGVGVPLLWIDSKFAFYFTRQSFITAGICCRFGESAIKWAIYTHVYTDGGRKIRAIRHRFS